MSTQKNTTVTMVLGAFIASLILILIPDAIPTASAQASADQFTTPVQNTMTNILEIMAIIFQFINFMLYLLLYLIAKLLDPEVIEAVNGVGDPPLLLRIWQISRDIVNVIFAFLFIFAALYTTITANRELVSSHIGKFIVAVILVNFSWFFPRVILDTANVLTATVYMIPSSIGIECRTWDAKGTPVNECKYVTRVHLFPDEAKNTCVLNSKGNPNDNKYVPPAVCVELSTLPNNANTGLAMLHGLYINHIRIIGFGKVIYNPAQIAAGGPNSAPKELMSFVLHFAFVTFYMIATFFPLLTMAVVFFIRIPIIWLTTAFMPFMFIGLVAGDKMGEFNTMELIFKKFVKAAFLPTVVAIPFAIGFIMINEGLNTPCPPGPIFEPLCQPQKQIIQGITNFWSLLWNIMAVVVIWIGFYSALKIDTIYESIGNSFKSVGETWGKFALKAPLAAPIIPLAGGESTSPLAASRALRNPDQLLIKPDGTIRNVDEFKKKLAGGGKASDSELTTAVNNIRNEVKEDIKVNINQVINGNEAAINKVKEALRSQRLAPSEETTRDFFTKLGIRDTDVQKAINKMRDLDSFENS